MKKKDEPHYKKVFPIEQQEEHKVSRRQFISFVGMGSLIAIALSWFKVNEKLFNSENKNGEFKAATTNEIPVGKSKNISHPETHKPIMLIHLTQDNYVAYSQSCTHLMCPVHYNNTKQQLVCPCHEGYFDVKNGDVLKGPPPKPLPSYDVRIQGKNIYLG